MWILANENIDLSLMIGKTNIHMTEDRGVVLLREIEKGSGIEVEVKKMNPHPGRFSNSEFLTDMFW